MRAIVNTIYGPPEVVRLMEVDKPIPKENEVLVKVYASTVNRTDSGFRSAEYFISRLMGNRSSLFALKVKYKAKEVLLIKAGLLLFDCLFKESFNLVLIS